MSRVYGLTRDIKLDQYNHGIKVAHAFVSETGRNPSENKISERESMSGRL